MLSESTGSEGSQAKAGVNWNGRAALPVAQAFDTVSLGASVAVVCGAFVGVRTGLHGPYDSAGRPFVGGGRRLPSRIARTRRRTVSDQASAAGRAQYSGHSATCVVVWTG